MPRTVHEVVHKVLLRQVEGELVLRMAAAPEGAALRIAPEPQILLRGRSNVAAALQHLAQRETFSF